MTLLDQFGPESGAVISRWPFGPIGAVGVDDLIDHPAHVHDAVDLRPPRVVILLLDRVRRQSSGKLFGVIMGAARHPASGFHAAGDLGVIGILFVMAPGIPAHDRIDLEQADQEDEPALQLILRDVGHAVIGVVQIKSLFETEHAGHLGVVALVAEHVVADAAGSSEAGGIPHVIVRGPHKVAGVSLLDELGDRSRRGERDVVRMRLDRQQHLALVRRPFCGAFEENLARRLFRPRLLR